MQKFNLFTWTVDVKNSNIDLSIYYVPIIERGGLVAHSDWSVYEGQLMTHNTIIILSPWHESWWRQLLAGNGSEILKVLGVGLTLLRIEQCHFIHTQFNESTGDLGKMASYNWQSCVVGARLRAGLLLWDLFCCGSLVNSILLRRWHNANVPHA